MYKSFYSLAKEPIFERYTTHRMRFYPLIIKEH